jgi:hypothetical protein
LKQKATSSLQGAANNLTIFCSYFCLYEVGPGGGAPALHCNYA